MPFALLWLSETSAGRWRSLFQWRSAETSPYKVLLVRKSYILSCIPAHFCSADFQGESGRVPYRSPHSSTRSSQTIHRTSATSSENMPSPVADDISISVLPESDERSQERRKKSKPAESVASKKNLRRGGCGPSRKETLLTMLSSVSFHLGAYRSVY